MKIMDKSQVLLAIVLSLIALSFRTSYCYKQTVNREDEETRNKVTVWCSDGHQSVNNGIWLFNGSKYQDHPCTKYAASNGSEFTVTLTPECEGYVQCGESIGMDDAALSLPLLLLTYPTLINDSQTLSIVYANPQDTITIPCGISVSATGNFAIEWTESYTVSGSKEGPVSSAIDNPILGADYSLTVPSQRREDTIYTCQAKAKPQLFLPDIVENQRAGPATKVQVIVYAEPEIQGLSLEESNDDSETEVSFILSAAGTENTYKWKRNGEELTEDNNGGIEIDPSPPTLRLPAISGGDTIQVEVKNTNPVHGDTNVDTAWAFILAASTKSDCSRIITVTPSSGAIDTDTNNVFGIQSDPGIFNVLFFLIIVILLVLLVVGLGIALGFTYRRNRMDDKRTSSGDESLQQLSTEQLTVRIKEHSFTFKKNDMEDFFFKLELAIGTLVLELKKTGPADMDIGIKENVKKLRTTLLNLKDNDKIVADHTTDRKVRCDSGQDQHRSPLPRAHQTVTLEAVELTNLQALPNNHEQQFLTSASPSPPDSPTDDALTILLPSLAKLIQ